MVGRGGLEPPTSRLSGVRSNHLSYRPTSQSGATPRIGSSSGRSEGAVPSGSSREDAQTAAQEPAAAPRMAPAPALFGLKGHEDGLGSSFVCPTASHLEDKPQALARTLLDRSTRIASDPARTFPRKEVIQPQVPLRLPCYDFTPVAEPTVAGCFLLRGWRTVFG